MFNESLNEFNEDFAVLDRIKCLVIPEKEWLCSFHRGKWTHNMDFFARKNDEKKG